jgi:hypothetical protein
MESKIEKREKVASFFLDLWWMSEYKNCGIYFRTIIKLGGPAAQLEISSHCL